jgi:ankyrin repeat protein/L-ascorbate metabolism protein UlaG (beta-lactamase superfamily)
MNPAVKILVALGILVSAPTCPAQTSEFFDAAGAGDIARMQELLAQSPELLNAKGEGGETALQRAADEGQLEAVRILTGAGAEVDAPNDADQTALLFAAYRGHAAIVDTLIAHGAAFDFQDQRGNSPLHFAAREGRVETVQLLLAKGAAFDRRGARGRTPLCLAAMRGNAEIVRILAARGASLEIPDEEGQTPLAAALAAGQTEAAKALIEAGASLGSGEEAASRNLIAAAAAGDGEVVDLLLASGADPTAVDPQGLTLLHGAAIGGLAKLVQKLAEAAQDLNAPDGSGRTPLSCAVSHGHADVVQVLLDGGADPSIPDATGRTALQLAEDGGWSEIAALLRAKGAPEIARPVRRLERRSAAPPGTPSPEPLDITYIGNEGFLISRGERKIIIDALNANPWGYVSTGARIFGMMRAGRPPFDGLDVCVASHAHADHSNARMTAELLRQDPRLIFVSSPVARDSVLARAGDAADAIRPQIIAVDPPWNSVETHTPNGIQLEFFGVNHADPSRPPYKTLATLIDLDGVRLLHLADEVPAGNLERFKAIDPSRKGVDIAFVDQFFLGDSSGVKILQEYIRPSWMILMHARPDEIDEAARTLAPLHPNLIIFREQMERTRFAY